LIRIIIKCRRNFIERSDIDNTFKTYKIIILKLLKGIKSIFEKLIKTENLISISLIRQLDSILR